MRLKKIEEGNNLFDVVVIGGGPAGMAAALSANKQHAKVMIIEREKELGGILKQCIHDGFGLKTFNEGLTGPEYMERYSFEIMKSDIEVSVKTYVMDISEEKRIYRIRIVNEMNGVVDIETKSIVLANGCRERTSKQIFIGGTRPAGIMTAGTAQYLINIDGHMPCKKCVVLGSGDIGLIMARRITLEGGQVLGVYEVKHTPSGLQRNIYQCLKDYDIPLHLGKTIVRVIGKKRVEGVEICSVDKKFNEIEGTREIIECDGVILSVGLIPENELAELLKIKIDLKTKGPIVDDRMMTSMKGIFSCGNALHVNDLVDYVTESGELAGYNAALYARGELKRKRIFNLNYNKNILYVVPQKLTQDDEKCCLFFRSRSIMRDVVLNIDSEEKRIFSKKFRVVRPPEMEKIIIDKSDLSGNVVINLESSLEDGEDNK